MKLATIEKIVSVENHPNADRLDIATVLGYQCIVPRGKWTAGDWCILIQPDTVLPDVDWAQPYKSKSNRVKAIKLRDVWSFGIVEDLEILPPDTQIINIAFPVIEGEDVSGVLGVTKYEAPQPQDLNAKGSLRFGICKTDEERWQNLQLEKFFGEKVDITLKVDGQSFTAFYVGGEVGVTGRTMEYKLDSDNNFTRNFRKYDLAKKLTIYCEKYGVNLALRGEQYGAGIQNNSNNHHSKQPLGVMFFSAWDIDNRRYFSPGEQHYFTNVCQELDLPMVPLLERTIFGPEIIARYEKLMKTVKIDGVDRSFEGVVVVGNGFSFKIINLEYDSRK